MSRRFERPGRVVVKVGSSSLRAVDGGLDRAVVGDLVAQLARLRGQGIAVVLVSSGAVAAGLSPLGMNSRPSDLPGLQAAASVGQGLLLHTYQARFAEHGLACGQVLLTTEDMVHRTRFLNARNTFQRLLGLGAVPVVNENDTVATDELRFTDNDRLAALVASMLGANLLVLLSDVDGLHDDHPATGAPLLDRVDDFRALGTRHYGLSSSGVGTGGMGSKLEAARIATFSAAHTVIANARRPGVVAEVVGGRPVGTWFPPSRRRPESRKLWIAFAPHPRGRIVIDDGAVRALTERGSSLLAAGITDAQGDFGPGDAVDVVGPDGRIVARGLVAHGQVDVLKVRGLSSDQVASVLGDDARAAVIHRDQLIVVA
ncbi:MAG: glutamate 5-kinase [Nitriliruptorales bacterium]|nr:glutamate 5-kinase [Nitriliruptorales bacterium]